MCLRRASTRVSITRSGAMGGLTERFSSALRNAMSKPALCATSRASPTNARNSSATAANNGFSLPPEVRNFILHGCSEPKALHFFAIYFDNLKGVVLALVFTISADMRIRSTDFYGSTVTREADTWACSAAA